MRNVSYLKLRRLHSGDLSCRFGWGLALLQQERGTERETLESLTQQQLSFLRNTVRRNQNIQLHRVENMLIVFVTAVTLETETEKESIVMSLGSARRTHTYAQVQSVCSRQWVIQALHSAEGCDSFDRQRRGRALLFSVVASATEKTQTSFQLMTQSLIIKQTQCSVARRGDSSRCVCDVPARRLIHQTASEVLRSSVFESALERVLTFWVTNS